MTQPMRIFFSVIAVMTLTCCTVFSAVMDQPLSETPPQQDVHVDKIKNDQRRKLLDLVRKGVVIVNAKAYVSMDGHDWNSTWTGTGFIVDLERGLIATNRHVVGDNSVCTYEIKFSNGTKIEAKLAYFDPLYDFAFLSFDPKQAPKEVQTLKLSDKELKVNDSIFSMGNSAGDEFSTYKGTVFSALENIGPFPEQSIKFSGLTVGGASGSPVFNEDAEVVAIIYGGKFVSGAALPIRYVKRALEALQKNKLPQRRSAGLIVKYEDLKDLTDAGVLAPEAKDIYQTAFPEGHNKVLVVDTRLVNSPGSESFKAGDVIWKVKGELIGPQMAKFDEFLDNSEKLEVEVYRDGKLQTLSVATYDLQPKYSTRYVSFAGATWHDTNELLRLNIGDKEPGVYISSAQATSVLKKLFAHGWFGSSRPVRVIQLDGHTIKTLDDLEKAIRDILDKKKKSFSLRYLDFLGVQGFGGAVSADRQERFLTINTYEEKFDAIKTYTFDKDKKEWIIESIQKKD